MSVLLADIDATCAALGCSDAQKYLAEPDAIQGLKHLIWILRRDLDNHEYRRHLGHSKVLQTDLVYMLPEYIDDNDFADVLIRLLVILTSPTLLLYRDGPPKDNHGRKVFLELIDILQSYKSAFTRNKIWSALFGRLQKALEIDWALRSEEDNLLIERILVLIRNVLHVPANPEAECRADNDASVHDQVIWALHQSGILDLVLFIISSPDEHQFHLHCLEILCLLYREQTAESLADASLQRSVSEKQRDEQELLMARRRERQRVLTKPAPGRHSRFGGTYVIRNMKSVSDRDIICHKPLERVVAMDFDREKEQKKRSHRHVTEEPQAARRSAFSVRLCLREYCIEVLRSAYNTLVRHVRRVLERNAGSTSHDDSYLLWAIRFFMEFNRLSGLQLHLVSESLSVQCFHWVLTRIQHNMDMISSDKKQARAWAKRLHVALQTFRELLLSMLALQKLQDENARALFDMLLNNVCYVLEYRETILHLLMNYNEAHSTKAYLRDIVEMANIFTKMMEKFCTDSVVVQDKRRARKRSKNSTKKPTDKTQEELQEELENKWVSLSSGLVSLLTDELQIPEEDQPLPFDAASDKSIDDQKEDCMARIHKLLREEKLEQAISLLRSAREVWPENDVFGAMSAAPEDELLLLREIYVHNITADDTLGNHDAEPNANNNSDEEFEEMEDDEMIETTFKFDDYVKRLLNPKIVRACTIVLGDWEQIPTKSLKAAVTILHRIAYGCSCPAMLYQAKLFRIFQQVFHAACDAHSTELRRLGIFVVRKFVEAAPTNPKIYAELLFYKSIKEANDLENGYCDVYDSGAKGSWTEEQETELRMLFEENQCNPATDMDVIDWILENLIDKTRTRRGVLKKLKEMGLMFKAPTKRSTASAANKRQWRSEEDEELRSLYGQYRMEKDCLQRIMEEFADRKSKQQIINRMLQLYLIADKSEILPQKPKKRREKQKRNENGSERGENSEDDEMLAEPLNEPLNAPGTGNGRVGKTRRVAKAKVRKPTKPAKRKVSRTPLDIGTVRALIDQIDRDKYGSAIDWLKECLDDAAEETDEPLEEDDGIPLVPLLDAQREAVESGEFQKVLIAVGIQPPVLGGETYWRIPTYLHAADLKLRAKIIAGEEVDLSVDDAADSADEEKQQEEEREADSSNDEKSEEDYLDARMQKQRQQMHSLVFSKSDNEEQRAPLKATKNRQRKQKKRKTERKESTSDIDDAHEIAEIQRKLERRKYRPDLNSTTEESSDDGNVVDLFDQLKAKRANTKKSLDRAAEAASSAEIDELNFNSEDYRKRLAELGDSDEEAPVGEDNANTIMESNKSKSLIRRANVIDSDSDDDDEHENADAQQDRNWPKDTSNTENEANYHGDANNEGVIDKTSNQLQMHMDAGDDATNAESNTAQKRTRPTESDCEDVNNEDGVRHSKDATKDDVNDVVMARRSLTEERNVVIDATVQEPAKRRRIAIVDDDDDDDDDED